MKKLLKLMLGSMYYINQSSWTVKCNKYSEGYG